MSPEIRNAIENFYSTAMNGSKKIACLVNANNKGYCRVKLDKEHIKYFKEIYSELDTMNRCYLQRILYDQVRLQIFQPAEFVELVCREFAKETE